MLPEAKGVSSIDSKRSSTDFPNAASMLRRDSTQEWVGARSCRLARTRHSSTGNMSSRVADHCPHLMKAAPLCRIENSNRRHAASRTFPRPAAPGSPTGSPAIADACALQLCQSPTIDEYLSLYREDVTSVFALFTVQSSALLVSDRR